MPLHRGIHAPVNSGQQNYFATARAVPLAIWDILANLLYFVGVLFRHEDAANLP